VNLNLGGGYGWVVMKWGGGGQGYLGGGGGVGGGGGRDTKGKKEFERRSEWVLTIRIWRGGRVGIGAGGMG